MIVNKRVKATEWRFKRHGDHHRYFECNYVNLDVPWDKLFGSFQDGTDAIKPSKR